MTWCVIALSKEKKTPEYFEINGSLKYVLDFLTKKKEEYFLLFDDKRKLFLSEIRGHLRDARDFSIPRVMYNDLPTGLCDFFVSHFVREVIWLDKPQEGCLKIDIETPEVFVYGFGIPVGSVRRFKILYEKLGEVFCVDDFYKILGLFIKRKIGKKRGRI